jgi:hypothetical protein
MMLIGTPQQQEQEQNEFARTLFMAFSTGIATAAGTAFFNDLTKSQRRLRRW